MAQKLLGVAITGGCDVLSEDAAFWGLMMMTGGALIMEVMIHI